MYFKGLFENLPIKSIFKWLILIADKRKCTRSTGVNLRSFIIFDIHKPIAKRFTA